VSTGRQEGGNLFRDESGWMGGFYRSREEWRCTIGVPVSYYNDCNGKILFFLTYYLPPKIKI